MPSVANITLWAESDAKLCPPMDKKKPLSRDDEITRLAAKIIDIRESIRCCHDAYRAICERHRNRLDKFEKELDELKGKSK